MTYIAQARQDETERAKWREQANRAAAHLKSVKDWGQQITFKPMFVFDDGMVELPLEVALIQKLNEQALADWIFETVLDAQNAAPQGVAPTDARPQADANPRPALEGAAADQPHPVGAAPVERCRVKEEEKQCENQAVGGLRANLYATPTIQKRYGRRVMLSLIFDLPVCAGCISKLKPEHFMDGEQWKAFSKVAQQRNSGVLADRSQTEVVLCLWDEPEYVALRKQIAQHRAANDSQPAPAGPQQGAGDGT